MWKVLGSFALLFEMSNRRVRSPEDLAECLGVPVLSVIEARNSRHSGRAGGRMSLPKAPAALPAVS